MYHAWITPNRCLEDPDRPTNDCELCGAHPQGGATSVLCLDGKGVFVCQQCVRKNKKHHKPVRGWIEALDRRRGIDHSADLPF